MRTTRVRTTLRSCFFLALLAAGTAARAQPAATPTLGPIETVNAPDGRVLAVIARAPLGEQMIGLAIDCETPATPRLTVQLGSFPSPARALQLAVRDADGRVQRFGPVFRAGARSGFHSPQLAGADLQRFLTAIRGSRALVSNGYTSYFVQADADEHATLQRFADTCE